MSATKDQLKLQLHTARSTGLFALLEAGSSDAGLPLAFVLAIGSRETNLTNELGDSGHGHGVLQIDDRTFWVLCHTVDFKAHPDVFIEQGCKLLKDNLRWARRLWPAFSDDQHLRVAADEYNCGPRAELRAVTDGHADENTTGHDYGHDVMCRMAIFEELLKA